MAIRVTEVIRSEVEGGLAGPANPIPDESIDCGCAQLPCPRLARFATRRLFVGLLSWVGLIQAAAYAYLHMAGPTIARRFQFHPYAMEWVLIVSDLTPFALGVVIAYWGDRIHRAAWIGAIVLLQSISYFVMIILHLTHHTKVVEETENVTHMSIYAEDSRDLCSETTSRIVSKEKEFCYFTLAMIIVVQVVSGIANISYFALGVSYLDDNTRKKHVSGLIGFLISVKIFGILIGCMLAWICLRFDAVTLNPVESYREQIGAWWLGLPIFTLLLVIPGLLLSWFPRMLPSEIVEKAAVSLLNNSNNQSSRAPRTIVSQNVGSIDFWPSLGRLITNKILMCQILACTLYIMAIVNFVAFENLIGQSRFHVPKPTGMLLGFEDPISSRLITNILKPSLVALIVVLSGMVISKLKPSARSVIGYSIIVVLLAAAIIFALTAATCDKKPIFGTSKKGSLVLLQYCNRNCRCSNDADFRPVCDNKGTYTFYSPCHAGCTFSEVRNGITTYSECSCVESVMGAGKTDAIDGPCTSNRCQFNWVAFEFGILLSCVLIASTFVGDILIILRSVSVQDKAISIGFLMTCIAFIPGKILYDVIANLTCLYWGTQKSSCRIHDGTKLGNYLCYMTGSLLVLCVILKLVVWCLSEDLKLYVQKEGEATSMTEMREMISSTNDATNQQGRSDNESEVITHQSSSNDATINLEKSSENLKKSVKSIYENVEDQETEKTPLKYGPLGPGDRRTDSKTSLNQPSQAQKSKIRNTDSEDDLSSSDEEGKKDSSPKVAYRPLDIDSDVESDLSSVEPRSRKRIMGREYESVYNSDTSSSVKNSLKREFPNPDNYGDPRLNRRNIDGSSKTSSFEFSRRRQNEPLQKRGNFNEVGIPIVDPVSTKGVKSLIDKYEKVDEEQELAISGENGSHPEPKIGIPLVAMTPKKSNSINQYSPGFSNLRDNKIAEDLRPESRESVSPKTSNKGSVGTLHTDF
ncbi:solute carrier organic anion transporter family member 1A5 isoform X2 [Apis mellifera]|nr:solute carrier organic anion transporter family member 1A5 isoform X2 [Apis mellifera]XP_016770106.2 solute carrier organic anion transporter family member 1A5 isoform X2 [Apis mellifera]XP_016770107.2 solute carrier organic anion transporter family member 1A5 isoform X2 [Apis mellifera]XP_016770108.2 solute carrier organic anion transporter family member 1A5 isoform X2 [Apis mellifera]|eukprot:XP_006566270.2 solute carrier organic anion transporter family member 1A5 isoform X2 [Apis mellifera]